METSNPKFSNSSQPLFVSTVLSTNVSDAKHSNINHKASKEKLRRCRKCRKTFKNQGTYLSHVKFHNVRTKQRGHKNQINKALFHQQEFRCKMCETNFTGVSAFLEHTMKSHGDQSETYSPLHSQQVEVGSDVGATTIAIPSIDTNSTTPQQQVIEADAIPLDQTGQLPGDQIPNYITNLQPNHHASQNQSLNIGIQGGETFTNNTNHTGMHIEIPTHVRSLSFNNTSANTNTISQLNSVMKLLSSLHSKIDIVIKHLNIDLDEEGNTLSQTGNPIEVIQASTAQEESQEEKRMEGNDNDTVLLEGFPPSYSIVQAAKEQQQQEFYALTLSNRQTQQLTQTSNDIKLLKGKGIDLWVPTSHQYILAEAQPEDETTELSIPMGANPSTPTITLPNSIVDKIFVESRSRANFAKNLTFAIFTQEERRGKNCTGRVFGKAQHKGQLDPVKLAAVKEATFRKYPCNPNLMDITWRKECITAIDSGLRNEHRSTSMKTSVAVSEGGTTSSPTHQHQLVVSNVTTQLKQETALNEPANLIET